MSQIDQHRSVPDLLDLVKKLERRIQALEGSTRLGNSSIDGGELTVKGGDIVVRTAGDDEVLRIEHGNRPRISMRPVAAPGTNYGQLLAWESGGTGVGIEVGVLNPSDQQDGGKVLLMQHVAFLSHQPSVGGDDAETYMALSEHGAYPNHISYRGKFQQRRVDGREPWEMGYDVIGAGFGAASYLFDQPYEMTPMLLYSISGATANFNHCIVSVDTSGFTIGWSDALAHNLTWLAIRR
jgi:hypothetical protein